MNYLAASCRGIKKEIFFLSLQAAEYLPAGWQVRLIYPDTLRYRDSFDLQISMRFTFEI
jgi:hypothetical protein